MRGIIKSGSITSGGEMNSVQGPRVIAVTSGKGGVGKTNITLNLAMALSSLGQRVVIFDADLGMANVEVLLGVNPRYTLFDFLYNNKSLYEIITPGPNNIKLISGGSGLLELANLSQRAIKQLRDTVNHFDVGADIILVDTGAGINKNVLAFVGAAQEVIVVATPEPTSITDAYGLIKVLASYNVHREVNLVVNKVDKEREAKETYHKLEVTARHFLINTKIRYLGSVKEDVNVVKAVRDQQPFMLYQPDCAASQSIKDLAAELLGNDSKDQGGFSGFFTRLTRLFS
ncbi:MAG: MinD/ParA family protein [Firmicutes bacterium]|nr:MinD/ParA family protein [Bacillota bacterium]